MPPSHTVANPLAIQYKCRRYVQYGVRIIENKNAPEVDNLLNNEPTRINTAQIANDGKPSRTKNNELEPIQIRTG